MARRSLARLFGEFSPGLGENDGDVICFLGINTGCGYREWLSAVVLDVSEFLGFVR